MGKSNANNKIRYIARTTLVLGAIAFALAGCGTRGGENSVTAAPNANGYYKVGNPYQIDGAWYYPAIDWNYNKTGIASWYGPDFHGKYTANGERFDMNSLTGASPTLPMPSIVEVTNLDNGRSIQLRINDRGPFARNRILDISRRGAQLLGFKAAGTAHVRVRLLRQETLQAQLLAQRNGGTDIEAPMQLAAAQPVAAVSAQPLTPPPTAAGTPAAGADLTPAPRGATSRLSLIPQAEAATPKASSATTAAATGSKMYIQAGAFSRVENAERLKTQLAHFGTVNVDAVKVNGASVYRVRIGPIATTQEADRTLSKVIDSGVTQARLAFDW